MGHEIKIQLFVICTLQHSEMIFFLISTVRKLGLERRGSQDTAHLEKVGLGVLLKHHHVATVESLPPPDLQISKPEP